MNRIKDRSKLFYDGRTKTSTQLHKYAGQLVKSARAFFDSDELCIKVNAYRIEESEVLKFQITEKNNNNKKLIVHIADWSLWSKKTDKFNLDTIENDGEGRNFSVQSKVVHLRDMAEALHFTSIVSKALHCEVTLGEHMKELNSRVTRSPLTTIMNLWRK